MQNVLATIIAGLSTAIGSCAELVRVLLESATEEEIRTALQAISPPQQFMALLPQWARASDPADVAKSYFSKRSDIRIQAILPRYRLYLSNSAESMTVLQGMLVAAVGKPWLLAADAALAVDVQTPFLDKPEEDDERKKRPAAAAQAAFLSSGGRPDLVDVVVEGAWGLILVLEQGEDCLQELCASFQESKLVSQSAARNFEELERIRLRLVEIIAALAA
jgi:hypothetical protein